MMRPCSSRIGPSTSKRALLWRIRVVVRIGCEVEIAVANRRMARACMAKLSLRSPLRACKRYYRGSVPNWIYLFFNALYDLGLAIWIGGVVVISAIVAPAQFARFPRYQAIVIMAPILRRFARLR